jgi:hypothetical protein
MVFKARPSHPLPPPKKRKRKEKKPLTSLAHACFSVSSFFSRSFFHLFAPFQLGILGGNFLKGFCSFSSPPTLSFPFFSFSSSFFSSHGLWCVRFWFALVRFGATCTTHLPFSAGVWLCRESRDQLARIGEHEICGLAGRKGGRGTVLLTFPLLSLPTEEWLLCPPLSPQKTSRDQKRGKQSDWVLG